MKNAIEKQLEQEVIYMRAISDKQFTLLYVFLFLQAATEEVYSRRGDGGDREQDAGHVSFMTVLTAVMIVLLLPLVLAMTVAPETRAGKIAKHAVVPVWLLGLTVKQAAWKLFESDSGDALLGKQIETNLTVTFALLFSMNYTKLCKNWATSCEFFYALTYFAAQVALAFALLGPGVLAIFCSFIDLVSLSTFCLTSKLLLISKKLSLVEAGAWQSETIR